MKTFKLYLLAVLAISLAACSGGGKVSPTSKKVNGPLGKYFEVVEREYKIKDKELSVEFKRIAEGGPNDASWSTHPTFLVELQDEDGNVISTKSTDVVLTEDQLETVFSLAVDETASVTFKFDKTEGAVKFKVSSKWEEKDGDSSDESSAIGSSDESSYDMRGKVDKYPITMHLDINGTQVKGSYYYDKQGANAQLNLSGTRNGDVLDLNETDSNGTPTGHFKGILRDGEYRGQFITNKGKSMPFAVTEGDVDNLSFDDDDSSSDSSYDDSETSSSSGSSDWDELLDSYEQYVDDYIALLKKAKNGDMSAISEYASVLQDANDLNSKIGRAKSDLSSSQLARYNKISMKLAKAAQQIQ